MMDEFLYNTQTCGAATSDAFSVLKASVGAPSIVQHRHFVIHRLQVRL